MTTAAKDSKWVKAEEQADSGDGNMPDRVKFPAPPAGQTSTTVLVLVEDDFEEVYSAFIDDTTGAKRRVNISPDNWRTVNTDHPLIGLWKQNGDDNLRPGHKYLLSALVCEIKRFQQKDPKTKKPILKDGQPVIVRKVVPNPAVMLLEVGPKIFKQLSSYRNDGDYPDIDKCVIKIERTGSGKNDTSYVVKANGKNFPKLPDGIEPLDIAELAKETAYPEVCKILGLKWDGPEEGSAEEPEGELEESAVADVETEVEDTPAETETEGGKDDMDLLEEI